MGRARAAAVAALVLAVTACGGGDEPRTYSADEAREAFERAGVRLAVAPDPNACPGPGPVPMPGAEPYFSDCWSIDKLGRSLDGVSAMLMSSSDGAVVTVLLLPTAEEAEAFGPAGAREFFGTRGHTLIRENVVASCLECDRELVEQLERGLDEL
jgi:hypothetical protein